MKSGDVQVHHETRSAGALHGRRRIRTGSGQSPADNRDIRRYARPDGQFSQRVDAAVREVAIISLAVYNLEAVSNKKLL
jgi:hypothetical protein